MVCVDTTFIVDILRGNKEVIGMASRLDKLKISKSIPAPVISEILQGIHLSRNPESENNFALDLINSLNVLSLDKESAILAGDISSNLMKKGQEIGLIDCMIAAITITNDETLVTRNRKHFERIDNLKIESY